MRRNLSSCLVITLWAISAAVAQSPTQRLRLKPQPVTTKLPAYPPIARAACAQGAVAVLVEVDWNGKVTSTDVLYGHPLLTRIAETTARDWTFDANEEGSVPRREAIRFLFEIAPFEIPEKKLKPIWKTPTDVQIRVYLPEPSCDDCSEKRRKELRRGGCPGHPVAQ
jgi:TonB family protein